MIRFREGILHMSFNTVLLKAFVALQVDQIMGPLPKAGFTHAPTGGILGPIVDVIILIIVALHNMTGSWGLAIILTAVVVKLLMFRLSVAQFTGMAWMQVLAPMQKQLTEHFKGDKEIANRKIMQLYQQLKINPMSGCLPLLIQLPIMFAIFQALYKPEIFGKAKFLGIHLMYAALPGLEMSRFDKFGFASVIDLNSPGVVSFMLGGTNVYLYIPALSIVFFYILSSLFYQHRMKVVQKKIPQYNFGNSEPPKQPFNPNFLTIIIVVFGMVIPAGAMLYFISQNILSIIEYSLIMNNVIPAIEKQNLEAMYKELIKKENAVESQKPEGSAPSEPKPDSVAGGDGKMLVPEADSIRASKSRRKRGKR